MEYFKKIEVDERKIIRVIKFWLKVIKQLRESLHLWNIK